MLLSILNRRVPIWLMLPPVLLLAVGTLALHWRPLPSLTAMRPTQATPHAGASPSQVPWQALAWFGLVAVGVAGTWLTRHPPRIGRKRPTGTPSAETVTRLSDRLDEEIAKIVVLLAASIDQHESFARWLENLQSRIATAETPEQLRTVVGGLIIENQRMRDESQRLSEELARSRAQIQDLRASLQRAEEDLHQAQEEGLRDPLTAIGNRRAFETALQQAIETSSLDDTPLSIVLLDLDAFKAINDRYGHQIGDEILKIFARLLTSSAREQDVVARYGGEEFSIIMPNTSSMGAAMLAERLRAGIETEQLKLRSGQILKITASLGVAQLRPSDDADTLVGRADNRLYKAKSQGRNRVVTR